MLLQRRSTRPRTAAAAANAVVPTVRPVESSRQTIRQRALNNMTVAASDTPASQFQFLVGMPARIQPMSVMSHMTLSLIANVCFGGGDRCSWIFTGFRRRRLGKHSALCNCCLRAHKLL